VQQILRPLIPFYWQDYRDEKCKKAGLPVEAMWDYDAAQGIYIPPTPQHPRQRPTPHYDALTLEDQSRVNDMYRKLRRIWSNAKNDSLGLYNHLTVAALSTNPDKSVFVTSDRGFLKASVLPQLRALGFKGEIMRPYDAVQFLTGC
jgi:hypothetical protein